MKKFILLLFLIFPSFIQAQTILLEEDVAGDTIPEKIGPNLKHYTHTYINYGFILGNSALEMATGKSYEFSSGIRYKYKLSEAYAIGLNFSYNNQTYRLVPINIVTNYDKEKISLNNLELELYNRINFGKRGNIIGKYIDIGAFTSYAISTKHYYRTTSSNFPDSPSKYRETIYKNLTYVNAFNYGVSARLGWEWIAIYGKYRLSNSSTEDFPELPKYTVGIELSIIN